MRLSKHFTLEEMTKSQIAARNGLANIPGPGEVKNLENVCYEILEPVRAKFGKPVLINSAFRALEVNRKLGSSDSSQHCKGQAVDFEIAGVHNLKVANWVKDNCDYDQLILEFYQPHIKNAGWIHVSYNEKGANRKIALTFDGKSYENGLPEMKYKYDKMGNEVIE